MVGRQIDSSTGRAPSGIPGGVTGGVTGGVDTHLDSHTVAVLDPLGRLLGQASFSSCPRGQRELLGWLRGHGPVDAVGVEGTGSYGAGLDRHLRGEGVTVVEVNRPDRATRRRQGKSDPVDAVMAARAVQAGTATGAPKTRDGVVESIRALRVARGGAIKARTAAMNTLHNLVLTAPDPLRTQLAGLTGTALVRTCARLRPSTNPNDLTDPIQGAKTSMRRLARRCQHLTTEIDEAKADLDRLIAQTAPRLLERPGVGSDVAGQLLVTAGDNPDRIHTDASFAALCGANPIPASSGRTDRHRLNRGGDRAANSALWRVVFTRMQHHQPTKDYIARRTEQGLTPKEIIRCLKRYVARELLPLIKDALQPTTAAHPETPPEAA